MTDPSCPADARRPTLHLASDDALYLAPVADARSFYQDSVLEFPIRGPSCRLPIEKLPSAENMAIGLVLGAAHEPELGRDPIRACQRIGSQKLG